MPNESKPAREKRTPPAHRQNAQGDHEGSAHSPEAFDRMNPQEQGDGMRTPNDRAKTPDRRQALSSPAALPRSSRSQSARPWPNHR